MNREWTIYSMQSHFNALKFDNVWQLRPSSSNSFSGETFATRQAFESKLRINWKCKVLFESAILHMSGRQNVGSWVQPYYPISNGTHYVATNLVPKVVALLLLLPMSHLFHHFYSLHSQQSEPFRACATPQPTPPTTMAAPPRTPAPELLKLQGRKR